MNLTASQQEAEDRFKNFLISDDPVFGLFGFAGTGKTFMLSRIIRDYVTGEGALLAAPTHKAAHVIRRRLAGDGTNFSNSARNLGSTDLVVGTTAQLLGIMPVIDDDQDATELKFKKATKGFIENTSSLDWVIIDEVSMLSRAQFNMVRDLAADRGAKVVVVGDPGQLPPVKADAIPFGKFRHGTTLLEVCRTDDDTGITRLATAVRNGDDWRAVRGSGIDHVANAASVFLAEMDGPPGDDERQWSVYVAYRNASVNAVNEAACQMLYGHSRFDVEPGEIVLANNTLRGTWSKGVQNEPLCTNGETLMVRAIGRRLGRWGINIEVRSMQTGIEFFAEYLPEDAMNDRNHPYNVELQRLRLKAQDLEKQTKADSSYDSARRAAWNAYFTLRDNTVLSVSHPFALTSHKSQGSTYCRAFVDATDMAAFDPRALYVGVTRPSDVLVVG